MKSNPIGDLRKMSDGELTKEMKKLQEVIFKLRFQQEVEENSDVTQARKSKRKIAQIKTLLHQRKALSQRESLTTTGQETTKDASQSEPKDEKQVEQPNA